MTDDELLRERIASLEESVSYFSSSAKADRELWVCDSFLRNLGIQDARARLSPMDDDPPDVAYLDLRFEVKEILDPGRRRHAEYKLALERARVSKSIGELAEVWNAEPMPLTKVAETVTDLAADGVPISLLYLGAVVREVERDRDLFARGRDPLFGDRGRGSVGT